MSRLRLSTTSWCLLGACLLHSALLAAALLISPEPAPKPAPAPLAATVTLIPPAPPAVSPPAPEPKPEIKPQPVSKPTPKPVSKPESKPAEPDVFAMVPEEPLPTAAPAPTETVAVADNTPSVPSEPVFDADYLKNPAPVYPSLSKKNQEQGVVLLRVLVSAGGNAEKLEVLQSSGYERLDEAALRAVKRWQFVPAKLGDQAVQAWVRVPVRFNLSS